MAHSVACCLAQGATVFSDATTSARASVPGDSPFTGGQGGGDDMLGLFKGRNGEAAADATDVPAMDTADPLSLGLLVSNRGTTAPVGMSKVK